MNVSVTVSNSIQNSSSKGEKWIIRILFFLIWGYVIARALMVFYMHDEIVTKWAYMIDWNPFPNQGYIDANNHLLLSMLGGFFVRLFQSDSMIVVRLASVLAFPIYFWSIYGLRSIFQLKSSFYGCLIAFVCAGFLIEYFSMARGYGLSLAFLLAGMQQTIRFLQTERVLALVGLVLAWILAVYANLTLIPFALAAFGFVGLFVLVKNQWKVIPVLLLGFVPLVLLIRYSLQLKEMGKLYYGNSEGFFETTVHSLTPYLWKTKHLVLDIVLGILFLIIIVMAVRRFVKERSLFDPKLLFPIFLLLSIVNIFGQHWLLDINFPEDRAVLYLVVFFIGALFYAVDELKQKWFSFAYIGLTLILFTVQLNFSHSLFFRDHHFDTELLTLIPKEVNGTPPSVGGRWCMENEMTRQLKLPFRAFQEDQIEKDTSLDYLIFSSERRPDIYKWYEEVHRDPISQQVLFKRKTFLPRKAVHDTTVMIKGDNEFVTISEGTLDRPKYVRCSGMLREMTIYKDALLVISAEGVNQQTVSYESISFTQNAPVSDNGEIHFDFTYALNKYDSAERFKVYIWNEKHEKLDGWIRLDEYNSVSK